MQIAEMEKGKGGRNHSYTSKVQYLSKNPVKNINISNNNSNNNFQLVKNLQAENEKLGKLLVSYQIKYEKYSVEERKLKFKVQQKEKENKYLNNKISKLSINTNKSENKEIKINSTLQNVKNQKERKLHASISSGTTPKQNDSISITKNYLSNSIKKINPQKQKITQSRTSSHMRKRSNQTHTKNNTTVTDRRNESCVVVNRRYQNFLEQFEANTLKIVNMEKKKTYKTTSMEAKKVAKVKRINNSNKDNLLSSNVNSKTNSHLGNTSTKQNVIINNYNNVNYINVYTSSYNGDSKKETKSKQRKTSMNSKKDMFKK